MTFLHVDLDAFYASVEQLDNPEYKGKPVIVGSLPTDRRGVVSTCSYEARQYGVHSAMPIVNAFKLCPHGIFLRGRMDRYHEKSREVISIFTEFSPDVQQMSVDEAFIDITGTERLFGAPEEVAKSLKKRVFEKTGLTVSVGVASTKYIAKISSGMSKPDGLFIVKEGKEEDFMLSLPLKKVWGIGEKTRNRINSAGFFTTKDLHKVSERMLQTLFGNATGAFLYNAVRGTLTETFSDKPKSRSISSERTFSFDLTDRYAIETAIMDISWDIMYRLFSEKLTSKTAHLKIRYEDFTTVSIQETSSRAISSADDLFARIKNLFDKKYENGRGIRLLGIAAQNIEDGSSPCQQDLFDFENEKKAQLEKTVIEIQKKNPKLQIRKARLLKEFVVAFIFSTLLLFSPQKIQAEDPVAIFNFTPHSPDIEFYAEGHWEAKLLTGFDLFNENNSGLGLSFTPPIFMNETSLSVWFLLLNNWYFEANIADDFLESTVAAGYQSDEIVKHVRLGNRHITFPSFYGITDAKRGIGSGSSQAPGIMAEISNNNWRTDAILRYDMTEPLEKTWVGSNESSQSTISLSSWKKGARFIFPDNVVEHIGNIYIEADKDDTVTYTDKNGIKYKKLSNSEYLIIPSKNMIVFDTPQNSSILVDFNTSISLGSFYPEVGFLGEIQNWFSTVDLENFALGNESKDFFSEINGKEVLIIQKDNYFSPFIDASLYSTSSFSDVDTASIVSNSTNTVIDNYFVSIINSSSMEIPGFTETDYFDEKNAYIHAYNNANNPTSASKQFPFAKDNPLIYLTPKSENNLSLKETDAIILVENFSQSPVLDIGLNIIPGSINVYRNGLKENLFSYDSKTGIVQLLNPQNAFDTIKITWQENQENATFGSLTSAIGYNYIFSPQLSMNVSSSVIWPILEKESFTTNNENTNGSINLALDVEYTENNLEVENIFSSSFYTDDITNAYSIDSMNSNTLQTKNLSKNAGLADNETLVPKLEKRPNSATIPQTLDISNKGTSETKIIRDSDTATYLIENNWEINNKDGYIYQTIDFVGSASSLASSDFFSISLKHENFPSGYKIYLQLGVDDNTNIFESTNKIPTWELTSTSTANDSDVVDNFDISKNNWQKVTVKLQDEDRAKLSIYQNARIILVNPNTTTGETGSLFIGAYELSGSSFSTSDSIESKEAFVQESEKNQLSEMMRFNKSSQNIVQYFSWDKTITTEDQIAIKYYDSFPLSNYRYLNFFSYIPSIDPSSTSIQIVLDTTNEYGTQTALDITLNKEALEILENNWHSISIDFYNSELLIDGIKVNKSHYTIQTLNANVSPTKITITFEGKGSIYLDELHLEDTSWQFKAENTLNIDYTTNEILVGTEENPLISNPSVQSSNIVTSNTPFDIPENTSIGLLSETIAKIDLLGITTQASMQFSSSNTNNFSLISMGHKIASTPVYKALEVVQFSEIFLHNPISLSSKKSNSFVLNFSPLDFNFTTQFMTDAQTQKNVYKQDVAINSQFQFGVEKFQYGLQAKIFANQEGNKNIFDKNYFDSWLDISKVQFSSGIQESLKRNIGFSLTQNFNIPSIQFSPSIVFDGKNNFTQNKETQNSSSDSFQLILPFSIDEHNFNASFTKRSYLDSTVVKSNNYIDDANIYINNVKNRNWAYKTAPFYAFFDSNIEKNMQNTIKNDNSIIAAGFSTEYAFSWSRNLFINSYDLIIPKSIDFSISRDIRSSLIDSSDTLQFATTLNFLSFNNFGKYGSNPIFNWYEQDEVIQSIKIAYKADKKDFSNWRLEFAGYNQTTLYFNTKDTLRLLTEAQVDTASNWTVKHTTKWNREGKSSFIVDGLYYLFPSLQEKNLGFNRSNSFTLAFAGNESTGISQSYGVNHQIQIWINEYFQIGLELGSDLRIANSSFTLANIFSISGKVEF